MRGGHATRGECAPGVLLVIEFDVDRGQDRIRSPRQQPQTADPGAGADLENRVRGTRRRENRQLRADRRRDRVDAEFEGVLPRRADGRGLDDEVFGVLPAQFLVCHVRHSRAATGRGAYPGGVSFGLTFDKLIIIAVIAVFLVGPDRLPSYAAQLARLVKSLRSMADGAKDRMREEMGPEFDEVDWKKLDPRQYDPRRIIREALLDDPAAGSATVAAATATASADAAEAEKPPSGEVPSNRYVESAYEKRQRKLGKARPAPYDVEST